MNYDIQCYIKLSGATTAVNVASQFHGVYLLESEGVPSYGKVKDVVTESYAEADGLRVWTPSTPHPEATDVKLKFCVIADDRYDVLDSLVAYIAGKEFDWWDTVRMRRVTLVMTDKTELSEHFHGDTPYIEAVLKFKNVAGKAVAPNYWTFAWSDPVAVTGVSVEDLYRNKTVTFTRENGTTKTRSFVAAFEWGGVSYSLINDTQLGGLSAAEYKTRLAAFSAYAVSYMKAQYPDFEGNVADVTAGAEVFIHPQ